VVIVHMASSASLLIAATSRSASWFVPSFEVLGILAIVSLARFSGRIQSMIAAATYTLFVVLLLSKAMGGRDADSPIEIIFVISSGWLCAFVASSRAADGRDRQVRRLVDTIPAMIWRASSTGKIDRWNRTMIQAFGKPADSSDDLEVFSRIEPDHAEAVNERWQQSVRLGIPYEDTYRILDNDGNYKWHLVRAEPFRDEHGRIINWYGIHTDIDALKNAETALQTREHELLDILDTMPSLLWSASPTGEVTHISKKVREYSGMSLEQFQNLGWGSYLHPNDFEETAKAFYKAVMTGETYNVSHRLRRHDGQYRWHTAIGAPLRDGNGAIVQWYGHSVDIDEQRQAEDHLRELRAKLSEASRFAAVAELSASIAHELNQPLMSVIANAQAGKRWLTIDPPNIKEAAASIEKVLRDGRAADETMQHIRSLFRRGSSKKRVAGLPEIIREAVRMIEESPHRRDISIEYDFADTLPMVLVDPIQIQEVFMNLISNALEAVESVPRAPHLQIRISVVNDKAILAEVIDNGPGLDDFEKVFDAFVTTKENGMGIGLAVSRSIVETHGGELWAENNPGGGARFYVRLPRSTVSSDIANP
jgi:PAS domain S-box-containing protein